MGSSGELLLYFSAVILIAVVIFSLFVGLVINLVLRSPLKSYLLSSIAVGVGAVFLVIAFLVFAPGNVDVFNGEPRSLKAWITSNELIVYSLAISLSIVLWQLFVRSRKR